MISSSSRTLSLASREAFLFVRARQALVVAGATADETVWGDAMKRRLIPNMSPTQRVLALLVVVVGLGVWFHSAWRRFQVTERRAGAASEARSALGAVLSAQRAYKGRVGTYATLEQLALQPTTQRYQVALVDVGEAHFRAVVTQTKRGSVATECDDGQDRWEMTERGETQHIADGFVSCY